MENNTTYELVGPEGCLHIPSDDIVARKLAMLFEGQCLGLGSGKAAAKYGYSRHRYYQVKAEFERDGSSALVNFKRGPVQKRVLTQTVENQVIRQRFLDPDASAAVIAQKLKQSGFKVSQRSVERIITERGLYKKNVPSESGSRGGSLQRG